MTILFVENEKDKKKEIIEYLCHILKKPIIKEVESIMSGFVELSEREYDYVLLDMSLPLYDSNVNDEDNITVPFGGLDILDEIERLQLSSKVIVITAFDVIEDDAKRLTIWELDYVMKEEYTNNYYGCIHYDQSSLEWKSTILGWMGEE